MIGIITNDSLDISVDDTIEAKVAQSIKAEEGQINPLNDKPFPQNYRDILASRQDLPTSSHRVAFMKAYHANNAIIVKADTGSGKSTQIPGYLLMDDHKAEGAIACTQPRRLAATSVAGRVAKELDVELGEEVGYRVQFDEKTKPGVTKIVYLTGGMLLANHYSNPEHSKFRCIIIDEAHERTVNTDILMAHLKKLLTKRPELKVIIMSATMDAGKFSEDFNNVPIFEGRSFPVRTIYMESPVQWILETTAHLIQHIHDKEDPGDILVFLSGVDEIQFVASAAANANQDLDVIPLYGTLSPAEQRKAFEPSSKRKCIIATNIAETSTAFPNTAYIIENGFRGPLTTAPVHTLIY
ncbi:P-loop containing nucleoside triphosphate hydrolase protein [Apiospora arundinis]|uniref:P-loop containing nucleoside triphosphate hydrolase protein n=1 Tax=Apiospora arundinis TaxID=335852 RepID=A0ABR2HT41_9PEZI